MSRPILPLEPTLCRFQLAHRIEGEDFFGNKYRHSLPKNIPPNSPYQVELIFDLRSPRGYKIDLLSTVKCQGWSNFRFNFPKPDTFTLRMDHWSERRSKDFPIRGGHVITTPTFLSGALCFKSLFLSQIKRRYPVTSVYRTFRG